MEEGGGALPVRPSLTGSSINSPLNSAVNSYADGTAQ